MCGIFSFTKTTDVTRRMTPLLAAYMNERGQDSWGMSDGEFIYKDVGSIMDGWADLDFDGPIYHTRAASVGAVSKRNAHPFEVAKPDGGKIIGVHNGHISNWQELKHKYDRKDLEVDSEHIFRHLAEGKDLKEINGWGAVIWFDVDASGVKRRFCSKFGSMDNLHVVQLTDGTLVAASTERALERAARFADTSIKTNYKIENNMKYEFREDGLYTLGAMEWDKVHSSYSASSRSYRSSNICAKGNCPASVSKDQLICKKCVAEIQLNYHGTQWAVV